MNPMRPDSDYLRRCTELHERSHDPHRQVGAIIVDSKGQILSEGANAPPIQLGLSKADSLRAIEGDLDWKYFMLEHAERNAINLAVATGTTLLGTTMYASLFPCSDCARAIVAAGIRRLVVPEGGGNAKRDEKWHTHYHYAEAIFGLAGLKVDFVQMGPT